jgi:hypothetical protein
MKRYIFVLLTALTLAPAAAQTRMPVSSSPADTAGFSLSIHYGIDYWFQLVPGKPANGYFESVIITPFDNATVDMDIYREDKSEFFLTLLSRCAYYDRITVQLGFSRRHAMHIGFSALSFLVRTYSFDIAYSHAYSGKLSEGNFVSAFTKYAFGENMQVVAVGGEWGKRRRVGKRTQVSSSARIGYGVVSRVDKNRYGEPHIDISRGILFSFTVTLGNTLVKK